MKKLLSFVLVAVIAVSFATNVYASGGEGTFSITSDQYSSFNSIYNSLDYLGIREEEYYTTSSWATYQVALTNANGVVNANYINGSTSAPYTTDEMNALRDQVISAINGLTPVANYDALQDAIDRVSEYTQDYYTTESWAEVTTELGTANTVIASTDQPRETYQSVVDRAANRLNKALNDLVVANRTGDELVKYDEIVADQEANETYTYDSYYDYEDEVADIMRPLGSTAINTIDRDSDVDISYSTKLAAARDKLVLSGKVVYTPVNTNDPTLPAIPNTADTVVSYIIMMLIGMFGIVFFGKKLADQR